jgi:hypothetical protein
MVSPATRRGVCLAMSGASTADSEFLVSWSPQRGGSLDASYSGPPTSAALPRIAMWRSSIVVPHTKFLKVPAQYSHQPLAAGTARCNATIREPGLCAEISLNPRHRLRHLTTSNAHQPKRTETFALRRDEHLARGSRRGLKADERQPRSRSSFDNLQSHRMIMLS